MESLAALAAVALLAWAYLVLGHGRYWKADQWLPRAPDPPSWPEVVAVVPARDEAEVLPRTLPSLLAQDYPGPFRVVLVDDGSTDGTGDLARSLARAEDRPGQPPGQRRPLTVVAGTEPPLGWAGKVWALAQGVARASAPGTPAGEQGRGAAVGGPVPGAPDRAPGSAVGKAPYLLFTDADVALGPGTVAALVRAAEGHRLDLVSQMARLRAETFWERALIPAFVYFFAQLYPFRRVNRPGARTAAAAGGCLMVRRAALEAAGGLERIRGALIDDVALGRLLKGRGGRVWLGHGHSVVSVRPHPRLADVWAMVARSAYTELRHSPALVAGTVLGLLVLYAVPPVAALVGAVGLPGGGLPATVAAAAGLAAWALMALTYAPTLRLYGLGAFRAAGLPAVALLYAAMTVDSARRYRAGRGGAWKGRTLPR